MLEEAKEQARGATIADVVWREGTATALPFADDTFDITLSCVGYVFGEPPEITGRELCRVTRPGERITFTSWTSDGPVPAIRQ